MFKERDTIKEGRMPSSVSEQLANLPPEEERKQICMALAVRLLNEFNRNHIKIEGGSVRAKTKERIIEKVERRKSTDPMRDIYGMRFKTWERDRAKIAKVIQAAFPETPEKFANGMPTVREYADPKMREFIKANFNSRISDRHSAMHVNFVFLRAGSEIFDIAEVQILTPREMEIFNETREEYENSKH
jgi:hypothetical protein